MEMVFGLFEKSDDQTQQQASDCLMVTSVTKRPRAIVVIFGHLGASVDQMSKYAQLYHDNKCSTICATAPILSLASNDTTTLGEVAITACRETARLIRTAEMSEMGFGRVPVVVHLLGNGGALVLEELEQRILEVVSKSELLDMMTTSATTTHASRRNMMKSSSARALMVKSGSARCLVKTPLVKSTSAPSTKVKGSMRSLLTATSLSDDEDDPAQLSIGHTKGSPKLAFVQEKLDALVGMSRNATVRAKPNAMDIDCVCSPHALECSSRETPVFHTPPHRQAQGSPVRCSTATPIHISVLPQFPMTSSNPLHRRLQRRRRRKLTSPNVKRIDMERSGLDFSATPRYNSEDRAYHRDMKLFASRLALGSLVFDSGPYFPSVEKELSALDVLLSGQNPAAKLLAQSAIVGSHGWNGITRWNWGLQDLSQDANLARADQFWRRMKGIFLTKRHAYIFSQADKICRCDQVRSLIEHHQKNGIKTIEMELVTSCHLQHRKRRCDKYSEFVEQVLNSLDGRMSIAQESMSEWFDSDEEDGTESGHEIVQQRKEKSSRRYSIVQAGCEDKT
ncbi:Eukaryotic protein of unknown function (DUF829) [Fragilaria crotonensis]|nr:Eukaryotic protein of unknown function (DUF829) [Fragilaria crotonensis]